MQLNKIQQNFISYIQGKEISEEFLSQFSDSQISIDNKLSIYKGHYYETLIDILMNTYPAVTNIVGEEFVKSMFRLYLESNPPSKACLNLYGHNFSEFIKNFSPAKDLIYLEDVARLEKLINESYYEIDEKTLRIENLNEHLDLKLKSSVKLLESEFPIDDIRGFSICGKNNYAQDLNIDSGSVRLMVNRIGLEIKVYQLEGSEFRLLNYIKDLMDIEESIASIINDYPRFDLSSFLQKFIKIETFSNSSTNI